MILAVMNAIFCNCVEKSEKFRTSRGFEPLTSGYWCDAPTDWATKQLTLAAGHLWVLMFPWGMNQRWNDTWNGSYMNCGYEIKWSYDPRSYLWTQFLQLRKEAWKIQDFNGVWTLDLAIPVRRSNRLSYEATDIRSWSFVDSNVPVRNESTIKWYTKWMKWYMKWIIQWTADMKSIGIAGEIAFITARIIASLDFISAVHILSISYIISSLIHSSREH